MSNQAVKYPAYDDCLNNPLNKIKGSERLVKSSEQTEATISKMEQVDKDINVRSKDGQAEDGKERVMNNQTVKADAGKPKVSLVPPEIVYDIARIREYGNNKYPEGGKDNWKEVEPERYIDAAYRHMLEFIRDPESCDEESNFPHLWHLACNIAFLCELFKGTLIPKEK